MAVPLSIFTFLVTIVMDYCLFVLVDLQRAVQSQEPIALEKVSCHLQPSPLLHERGEGHFQLV